MSEPWDRQPGEPGLWYERFEVYRALGLRRTVNRAFSIVRVSDGLRIRNAGPDWYRAAKRWHWKERAEAWDASERERLRQLETQRTVDAHHQRIDMIQEILDASFEGLLPHLQPGENADVRDLRLIFKDALEQQRKELPPDPAASGDDAARRVRNAITFTADDLLEAQRQLEDWRAAAGRVDPEEQAAAVHPDEAAAADASFVQLHSCLAQIYPDPAAARRIAERAGLSLQSAQFAGRTVDIWRAILDEAERNAAIDDLVAAARSEHPNHQELDLCLQSLSRSR